MKTHITVRPARAAIAAVLALGSTPLLAQEVAPAAPPPVAATQATPPPVVAPSAPVAATTAAPAPVMLPPAPVVQQVPATATPPVAEAVRADPAPVRTERVRAERPAARVAAPVAETAPVQAITPSTVAEPAIAPVESAPVAAATPAPVETAAPAGSTTDLAGNDALQWGLVGGGIVLLGGAGLLAMSRRRRLHAEENFALDSALRRQEPVARPVIDDPVLDTAPSYVEPVRRPVMASPIAAAASTRTVAPGHHGTLEAMVAAAPTAENPFRTRKNRLRRAHFIQRQGIAPAQHEGAIAAATSVKPETVQRPSPVYDFGSASGSMGQRRTWHPATT